MRPAVSPRDGMIACWYSELTSANFVPALWQHRTEFLDTNVEYRRNKGLAEIP